ncbi:MAG: glycosyl transferase family 2 [Gemmatimonadetes bacterium]|nr:glycosyl transferase family 2 [Gemmatimonadota bacterium]
MTRLSIVVPVYFNELNLPDTVPRLLALRASLNEVELELVFVDDGSGDRSLEVLREFHRVNPAIIKVVKLTRNFGSLSAVQAGLNVATGDCVGVIAADLQDPPELFIEMIDHWQRGVKVVLAVRESREDPLSSKIFSAIYYSLVRRYALPGFPKGGFDFFLVDRQVIDAVNKINEKNTNLMSLIFWLGYRPMLIGYARVKRTKGKSRWTTAKKVKLFIDSFVGFSYAPIRGLSMLGLLIAASAFAYAGVVFYEWSVSGIPVKGYAPTVILIALTSGIQMTMLGLVGEYLWRTLDEVRNRPGFVVDEVYDGLRDHK